MVEPYTGESALDATKRNEREVIDPITHLPLIIHDADSVQLEQIPPPPSWAEAKRLADERGENTKEETNERHRDIEAVVQEVLNGNWWDDPIGNQRRAKLRTSIIAAASSAVGALGGLISWSIMSKILEVNDTTIKWFGILLSPFLCCALGLLVGFLVLRALDPTPYINTPRQDCHDGSHKKTLNHDAKSPESAQWLNAILQSVWPIVNPSLFISIADMLEDTMQTTLPKLVRAVSVRDIGQGSEPVRILGVRWLDAGSAAQDVNGMKAEEGDFFNLEVAVAYRAKETTVCGMCGRSSNAHLLMDFWFSGGVKVPVWVELNGLLATFRMRIQLTPNPPFLSVMTLTILGLPKVTLKCTPLVKNFLNVMDVPGLSHWLQDSINLAVQEYVAPRSLTLDLKTLLMGRPKLDTEALGIVLITVRRAEGCQHSSNFLKSENERMSDLYVTLSWSKWGKPLWSTRIITASDPVWEETTALLVSPAEINAKEMVQLQVWDSDRFTVDDLVGVVEVDLSELMNSKNTLNGLSIRADGLKSEKGKPLPGTLHWECGYFAKTRFEQHVKHKHQNAHKVRAKIEAEAEKKLREAKARGDQTEDSEVAQQKKQDMKEKTDEIILASKPTATWPSGILSIRIEQITGLGLEKIKESTVSEGEGNEEEDDMPSAYCTVILNQQSVYKTRIKMKSNNPFFDASTERFIRDWRTTDVIISVRDSRLHEVNPVIGVVIVPLQDIFRQRSEFTDLLPLVGGIGYGRMRLSIMFRSVQLQLPKRLRGWDVGTLEIIPRISASSELPTEYKSYRLRLRTVCGKGKMIVSADGEGWTTKGERPIRLPVKKRYASCLSIEFRKHIVGPDLTPAFATLWLKEIPDDEVTISVPVRDNANGTLDNARKNATNGSERRLGSIELTLRFWPGLSGYHKCLADHDSHMADVMEVLDYAEDTQPPDQELAQDKHCLENMSTSSSSSEDDEADRQSSHTNKPQEVAQKDALADQLKGFKKKKKKLHHKHRGLMQWKAVRNVAWVGREVEQQAEKITHTVKSTLKHRDREVGIEKEV